MSNAFSARDHDGGSHFGSRGKETAGGLMKGGSGQEAGYGWRGEEGKGSRCREVDDPGQHGIVREREIRQRRRRQRKGKKMSPLCHIISARNCTMSAKNRSFFYCRFLLCCCGSYRSCGADTPMPRACTSSHRRRLLSGSTSSAAPDPCLTLARTWSSIVSS